MHETLRSLSKLRELERWLTPEALANPRRFIASFARKHLIRSWDTENKLIAYEQLPDSLSVDRQTLDQCRNILLDAGDGRWDPPAARARWCFRDATTPEELDELCSVAASIAEGAGAAATLGARRRAVAHEELLARHAEGEEPVTTETARVLERLSGPADPVDSHDRQVQRLEAFRRVAITHIRFPTDRVRWMSSWRFRDRADCEDLREQLVWIRWFIDQMKAAAERWIAQRSGDLRGCFLSTTGLATTSVSELRIMGLGETAAVEEVRRSLSLPTLAGPEIVDVSLEGNAAAFEDALQEAGSEAFDWPWVRALIDAWREVILSPGQWSWGERDEARSRLAAIGRALARVGSGRVLEEETKRKVDFARGHYRPVRAQLGTLRKNPKSRLPQGLLDAGFTAEKFARRSGHDVYSVISARLNEMHPDSPVTAERVKKMIHDKRYCS